MGDLVTVIGGSGFLGSYIVKELAKTGAVIKIVSRHNENAQFLRTCGAVGQIAFVNADAKDSKALEKAIEGSDTVINLVGLLYEKGKQTFKEAHVTLPQNIASLCNKHKVKRLVHISALGVDKSETSLYAQTKLAGEKALLSTYPSATILRPSVIFGPEDNFVNLFATLAKISPALPLIGGGKTKFQPVYVGDVAHAVAKTLKMNKKDVGGKIFELGGPKQYTFKEIIQFILKTLDKKRLLISLPFAFAKMEAFFLEILPRPMLTRDQVELLKTDNILYGNNGLTKLGIKPTPMESVVPQYLVTNAKKAV